MHPHAGAATRPLPTHPTGGIACLANQTASKRALPTRLPAAVAARSDIPFGEILLRNTSHAWCELDGPAEITGTIAGHPVTRTSTVAVARHLELSPDATAPTRTQPIAADQLSADLTVYSTFRDAPGCRHPVAPASWRLTIGRATRTVDNAATISGTQPDERHLSACHAWFSADALHVDVP